jgi:TPR repeat protein
MKPHDVVFALTKCNHRNSVSDLFNHRYRLTLGKQLARLLSIRMRPAAKLLRGLLPLLLLTFASVHAHAVERRVAFVVGNSAYTKVPALPNPKNDAEAVAAALRRSGFEVITAIDLDRLKFDAEFERFIRSLAGAELSVFYYSGHGIQVGGENRIIPVDAALQSANDLEVETVSLRTIMAYMKSNSKVQLVYLDSCRNNPFTTQAFAVGQNDNLSVTGEGLATPDKVLGSLVAFSTQPGAVAVDGSGSNSPFTESMLKHSFKLGVDTQNALVKVTEEVWQATNQKQKPWTSSLLSKPVFLAKPVIRIAAAAPAAGTAQAPAVKIGSAPSVDATPDAPSVGTDVQIAALLSESLAKPRRVPIGVGQVAMLELPLIRAANGAEIEISAAPTAGVMYLEGKALGTGDVIDQDSLRKVTFEPSIGSQDKAQALELKVAQAGGGTPTIVNGKIEPFVVDCDAEAGEPLDLQGVSPGKLPNEINPETAIAACTDAVARFPAVTRYKYQLGRAKLAAKDVPGANALFAEAASLGHIRATYQLGYLSQRGLGRSQDLVEANRLLKEAADAGDPFGMSSYGRNLVKARGAERNIDEGVKLLNRAVELGHTYAMNNLGALYYYGEGVERNPKRGIRFFEAGLARGDIYSIRNLGIAYLEGNGVDKDPATALALFKKASDGGHPEAPTNIGVLYFNGTGVKKDVAEAVRWYELGAERGDTWAASNLAWIHSKGPKKLRDAKKAVTYSSLAVALDFYKLNEKEKTNLAKLSADAKKATIKKLISEIGTENLETSADLDATIVALSRKAWQMRNPRFDLF